MDTPEKIEGAGKKKEDGNALYKVGKYARASKKYDKVKDHLTYAFILKKYMYMSVYICFSLSLYMT